MKITFFSVILAICIGIGLYVGVQRTPAAVPVTVPVKGPEGAVNFLTFGDWGTNTPKQKQVAETMAAYAEKEGNIQACFLSGDNFYMKLSGVKDPIWKSCFEDMYDIKRLNFPFFACLGNHDYDGNKNTTELEYSKLNPNSRWKMPARWYRVNLPGDKPLVSILMLESTFEKFNKNDWETQKVWMDAELAKTPEGVWKICVAHHTMFTNGAHGDNGKLQAEWKPIFDKHKVDFYLCGHDHDLQHLEIPGQTVSYVLAGGGGAGTRPMIKDQRGPFSKASNGFGHFSFTPEKTTVHLIDADGREIHSFEKSRNGDVKVITAGESDKATTKPPKTKPAQ